MKGTRYLCVLPPQNFLLQSNHEENIIQFPVEGHFTKYLTSIPQICQGHQKQGKSENCHSQEDPKEIG